MTLREALRDILGPIADADAMLADPELSTPDGLEHVVAFALIAVEMMHLETLAARQLVAWGGGRSAARCDSRERPACWRVEVEMKIEPELSRLDITRNVKPPPRGSSVAFVAGWRAREAGVDINPYAGSPAAQPPEYRQWGAGDRARGELGFDYSHRIGSGTRLGPFQY